MSRRSGLPAAAAALLCAALSGCRGIQSSLDPAGREAAKISGLWWLFFYVCTAVFVLVLAFLFYGVFRRRSEDALGARERGKTYVAIGAGATAAILLLFLVVSVSAGREIAEPAGPDALKVQVIGHQWWWEVRYPASPANRTVVTANEIHVPVGRPVFLELLSGDVIHSFWAPNLHGKKDLIPGRINSHAFTAKKAGVFRGQCAEFCGLQHAHMAFTIFAETPERYSAWYEKQLAPAAEPSTPSQERGRQVFVSNSCVFCHAIQGTPAFGQVAPDLTHVGGRGTLAAGSVANNPGNLAGWIADPQSIKPGNHMPPMLMAPEDLLAVTDYLESLK
ncbi:MAG: cytochrome c oxidase subunit II [Acidobacteria bacterium]|nr:cytochrome c oxidase subunit II [Acidobacteriota bacterium]MCA1611579.1 cytochrome c oxidase subunit II [Acidobacteriota bacterium]